ncbi:MAG: PAS domain S-box protein [Candidatus Hodarchaeota archaeon]
MTSTENITHELYENVLNNLDDSLHVINNKFELILISNAMKKWLREIGIYDNLLGLSLFKAFPFLSQNVRDEYNYVLKEGKSLVTTETTFILDQEIITETRKIPIIKEGKVVQITTIVRDITEYEINKRKLEESEEKYRTLTEQSFLGVAILQDDIIQYVNEQLAHTVGYTVEEIMAWEKGGFLNFIYPEDRKFIAEQARKKQSGESDVIDQYQFRGIKKNGDIIWLEVFSKTINYRGKPADFVTIHDITDEKLSEQKIKESEEKYRSIFNNMTEGFAYHEVIVDENNKPVDYKYIEVNPAFEKLTGLKADQMIGRKVTEILPGTENDPADWIGRFGKVGLTGIPLIVEDYSEALDRWYKVSGYSPKKGYFAVTFSDITEQKKSEIKIAESEEKYRNLFNNAPFAIVLFNIKGIILDCNDASNLITGYSKEELIGKNFRDFNFYVDIKSAGIEEREEIIKNGKIPKTREVLLQKKDGSQFWARTNIEFVHMGKDTYIQAIIQDVSEQKQSQIQLEESESKFRTIFEAIPDLYFLVSGNGAILDYRGREQDLYLRPEEFMGKKVIDILPSNLAKSMMKLIKKTLQTQESQILDYELEINGKKRFFESRYFYMSKDRVFIFIRDITERKNIEKQISDLSKFTDDILNSSMDTIFVFNPENGRAIRWNSQFKLVSGYTDKEIASMKAPDSYYNEEDFERAAEATKNVLETGTIKVEMSLITKDGRSIPYEYTGTTLKNSSGDTLIVSIGRDVSERKIAEERIKESEQKFRDLYEEAPIAYFSIGPDKSILRVNNAAEKLLGYNEDEFLKMKVFDLYPDTDSGLKRAKEIFGKFIAGESIRDIEVQMVNKEGNPIWVSLSVKPIFDLKGDVIESRSMVLDITDRKIAEEALRLSEKNYKEAYDRGNFYKDLFAHDMNNILQVINSSAELITYQLGESEKSKEIESISDIIKKQVNRGSKLITNVRTLSELEEKEVITRKVEIGSVLKNSISFVEKAYEERNVNISVSPIDRKYFTNANELLQDVFENVLINGVKYNENSNVEISVNITKQEIDEKNYFKIEFIDNGIGVADKRKGVIFMSGNRELKGSKGMGLGLSLVNKILQIFNGKIWIEDKVKGDYTQGSKFIIILPQIQ